MLTVLRFLHNDSIMSNLTASAIGFCVGALFARKWLHRHLVDPLHRLHAKHDELHAKVDRISGPGRTDAPREP